jgi:hypothetical protein
MASGHQTFKKEKKEKKILIITQIKFFRPRFKSPKSQSGSLSILCHIASQIQRFRQLPAGGGGVVVIFE